MDRWLAIKTLQYNQAVADVRDDYKELMRRVNRLVRDEQEARDDILENKIGERGYQLLFHGRNMAADLELESKAWCEVMEQRDADEANIVESLRWLSGVNERIKDLQNWQKNVRCLRTSFDFDQNESNKEERAEGLEFFCSVCMMCDNDELNPIVYCDICDTGVHQKCYGLEPDILEGRMQDKGKGEQLRTEIMQDEDEPGFTCDLCIARVRRRKDITLFKCIICGKNEGTLK